MEIDMDNSMFNLSAEANVLEVLPGVFLGPYSAAVSSKLEELLQNGITHILCIRQSAEAKFVKPCFPDRFRYLVLEVADSANENIIPHFSKVKTFVDECLLSGGKCLMHDNAGISRSAAFMIAYVMERCNVDYHEAFKFVQGRRFCIGPNDGFVRQLKEYQPILLARSFTTSNRICREGKRKYDIDDEM